MTGEGFSALLDLVDPITQLKEFAELHSQGILTDAEFEAQKAKILNA
jgi:DNA helicase HerA-like ATPase